MESRVAKMTWEELKIKAKKIGVAIIPCGTTERHGLHLPMETDAAIAYEVAKRAGEISGAVVFPTVSYGIVETAAFHGVFFSEKTYSAMIEEICIGIENIGFKKIIFLSGHHANNSIIFGVIKKLYHQNPGERIHCLVHCMTLLGQLMPKFIKGKNLGHADFRETALMLAIDGKHVYPKKAFQPKRIEGKMTRNFKTIGVHNIMLDNAKFDLFYNNKDLQKGGGYGEVEGVTQAQGEKILNVLSKHLSRIIAEIKSIQMP